MEFLKSGRFLVTALIFCLFISVECENKIDIDCSRINYTNDEYESLIHDMGFQRISGSHFETIDMNSYRKSILEFGERFKCADVKVPSGNIKDIFFPFIDSYTYTNNYLANISKSLQIISNNVTDQKHAYLYTVCAKYTIAYCCEPENNLHPCCYSLSIHHETYNIPVSNRFSRRISYAIIPRFFNIIKNIFVPSSVNTILRETQHLPVGTAILSGMNRAMGPGIAISTVAILGGTAGYVVLAGNNACYSQEFKEEFCKYQKLNGELLHSLHYLTEECKVAVGVVLK